MKTGDRVQIVGYGSLMWSKEPLNFKLLSKEETNYIYDWQPELVGRVGTVVSKVETQGRNQYSVDLDEGGKHAWYNEEQLKLLTDATNNSNSRGSETSQESL